MGKLEAAAEARRLYGLRPVVLDTETTGLVDSSEVVEVSVIDRGGDVLRGRGNWQATPGNHGREADARSTPVHGRVRGGRIMYPMAQPRRYGSKSMAKSNCLMMVYKGPVTEDPNPNRLYATCFGNESHYHKETGICIHVELLAADLKPWWRQRGRYLPFGDTDRKEVPIPEVNPETVVGMASMLSAANEQPISGVPIPS